MLLATLEYSSKQAYDSLTNRYEYACLLILKDRVAVKKYFKAQLGCLRYDSTVDIKSTTSKPCDVWNDEKRSLST